MTFYILHMCSRKTAVESIFSLIFGTLILVSIRHDGRMFIVETEPRYKSALIRGKQR